MKNIQEDLGDVGVRRGPDKPERGESEEVVFQKYPS